MNNQKQPRLELLAKELESVAKGKNIDLSEIIAHCRDDNYNEALLVKELMENGLRFFAKKLILKQYDTETI